jgi:Arc/MetJ-type ribon-helix-helix transcriptional regulator
MNKQTNIRLNEADQKLVDELKRQLGLTSTTELIRQALRALKEQKQ